MAQATDYNLANQSGADFRAELNEILAASVSLNSGSSEPTTMYAHQLWVDTSSNVLKIRNAANNAWLTTGVSITASNTFDINAGTINGITSLSFSSGATVASILDEDNLSSDSATALATQQSIKAYVDSQVTAQDLDITDGSSTIAIDLDSETLSLLGGTGITSTASGNGVTFAIGQSVGTSDNVVFNQVTGALVGNASTATTLATARTISGVSFNGSANITLDTDDIGEGSNNLYYTDARFDTRLASKTTSNLTEGSNLYYADSRARAAISENSAQLSYNSGTGVLTYTQGDTDTVSEGSNNLYYTDARANSAIDARVTNTFINNLSGVVADTATALATARTIALSGDVVGSVSFNGTSDVTISSTIQANSVALGTDTTGNYVATITGTANKVSVSGSGSETAGVTLSLPDDVQIADSLTVAGNLTVNGDLTYLDTTNLKIEDNLFELNANLTGSPVNDSGMLINRGNQNNGIFMWDESADKFTIGLTTADGTSTGNITLASLGTLVANLEGNVTGNVSGTAATVTGAAQTAITSVGSLSSLDVGTITSTGNLVLNQDSGTIFIGADLDLRITHSGSAGTITNNTGDLTLDVAGDIVLDADGGDILFKDAGSLIGFLSMASSNLNLTNNASDGDIIFTGNDGGSSVTALSLDMSDAGTAIFNHDVKVGSGGILMSDTLNNRANSANIIYRTGSTTVVGNNSTALVVADSGTVSFGSGIDVTGVITTDGLTTSADINFGDNDKAVFGAGSDLQIYHDSNNSYITDTGTGNLYIRASNELALTSAAGEAFFLGIADGSSYLYHNGSVKLNTTSTGIDVTGTATMDGLTVSGSVAGDYVASFENTNSTNGYGVLAKTAHTGTSAFAFGAYAASNALMVVRGDGNVAIGTDNPNAYSGYTALTLNNATNGGAIEFENNGTRVGTIFSDQTSTILKTVANVPLLFGANDAEKMRIDGSGRVGIGVSDPDADLEVRTTTAVSGASDTVNSILMGLQSANRPTIILDTADTTYTNRTWNITNVGSAGSLFIGRNGLDVMTMKNDGKVGIDCTPTEKLTVNGALAITGALVDDRTSTAAMDFSSGVTRFVSYGASGTGGIFAFRTASGGASSTEKMRLDASGNLGLGTSSPATPLHIESTSIPQLRVAYDGSNYQNISYEGSDIYGGSQTFKIAGSEKMRLDSSGNLLVGKTAANIATDGIELGTRIEATADGSYPLRLNRRNSDGTIIDFRKDGASVASIGVLNSNNLTITGSAADHGGLQFATHSIVPMEAGSDSNGTIDLGSSAARFKNLYLSGGVYANNASGAFLWNAENAHIVFGTNNAERMRIDSSGRTYIGTTSTTPAFGTGTGICFNVGDATHISAPAETIFNRTASEGTLISCRKGGTQVGSISVTASATAFNTSSDARLKDVTGEARGLEVINELNPVAYNWKADGKADEGLIAQEVLDIVPNAVSGSEEDMYQMDYSKLVVHLVAGMKEQQTQIEELKAEIQNLKGE